MATAAIGYGALAGWLLHLDWLNRLIPGVVSMNPATAGAFVLSGISLALSLQRTRAMVLAARLCALLVTLVGLVKFGGYLGGVDVPLDHWLPGQDLAREALSLPNRMAPNTSLNFLLIGAALLFVELNNRFLRPCFEIFVAIACLQSLIAILGHIYHVHSLYEFGRFSPMSFYTGTAFLVITCGYFLAHTDRGLLAVLAGRSAGGAMARVLLPAAILIPAALGWLIVQGQGIGLYRAESGEALFAVGNIVVFISVVCWSARSLFHAELESKKSEKALEWQTALLEAQINSSIDGILIVDQENKKILQNQRMLDLFKIPPHIANDQSDTLQLQWVADVVKDSASFLKKVLHLNAHPDEVSHDEIELKDGTRLERYSAQVMGKDGASYGRIWTFRDITKRREAEREARLNEQRYRSLVEATTAIVWSTPASGEFTAEQPGWSAFTGQSFQELGGWGWLDAVHPEDRAPTKADWSAAFLGNSIYEAEHRLRARDHSYHNMMVRAVPILDKDGAIEEWMGVHIDITGRKRLEAQLFQSQKLETVGKLAGGIAHEFNSILTAIIGQGELLINDLPEDSRLIKNATEINKAAERAAVLTRQLLAYGRKQLLRPQTLDLAGILKEMEGSLRHLMGEVDVCISSSPEASLVRADAGQIEQVIMNMAINARDAMPGGGRLTLDTSTVSIQADTVGVHVDLKSGDYVMLAISDSGTGMNPDITARIFEPFFSTKEVGEGTGLGLSTSYGIIKQSGGHIGVYSEPSHGTTFKIYLPRIDRVPDAIPSLNAGGMPRGTETILLVENDAALREMGGDLLKRLGYHVLTAADGIEALDFKQQPDIGPIDLLFTDVVMPRMSGRELSECVQAFSPNTRILFTSAYSESAAVHQGILAPGIMLLQKPYAPSVLARKIREVLDQPPVPSL